jgi:hypothetical protein
MKDAYDMGAVSLRIAAISVILLASTGVASAHSPKENFAEWLMVQKRPDVPSMSCCGLGDQFYVDSYQINQDRSAEVVWHGEMIHVPAKRIAWDRVNPTGRGVIWMTVIRGISGEIMQDDGGTGSGRSTVWCFIPGIGT